MPESVQMKSSIVLAAVVMAAGITGNLAYAQARSDSFREMLSHVPAAILGPPMERRHLEFADLDAAALALAFPPPGTEPVMTGPVGPALRAALGATRDYVYPDVADKWTGTVGFAVTDISAMLSISDLPDSGLILRLAPQLAKGAATVLRANGYADTASQGYPALFRGAEDYAIDYQNQNMADPFGGMLGKSSRVAFAGDLLIQAPGWPMLTMLARPAPPMLADQPEMSAILDALNTGLPKGAGLVRAYILADQGEFIPGIVMSEDLDVAIPGAIGVPPWTLGVFADVSDGRSDSGAIALVYATRALAQDAADRMAQSWNTAILPSSSTTLAGMTGDPGQVQVLGSGPFVTLLIASAPTTQSNGWIRNTVFDTLISAYFSRELSMIGLPSDAVTMP